MATNTTVLIVDDEEEVTDTYRDIMADTYSIEVANSGAAALETLTDAVDVVLLDRRMPRMTGDEILEEIRDRNVGCRVIMVTAVEPDIDIITMEFDEYLVKPVTGKQLNNVIERMLSRNRMDKQITQVISIGSRLATLESKLDQEQIEKSAEYSALRDEFHKLRQNSDLPDVTEDSYHEATLENIEALLHSPR